jgi:hypothetical protein
MPFQPAGALNLNGSVQPTVVVDPGAPPSSIIKANTPFNVNTQWSITGSAVPLIAGTFHVTAYFERYGNGPEPEFGPVNVPVTSVPLLGTTRNYNTNIPVPAGLPAGAYELIVLITYTDTTNAPGPIAGFSDQEVIIQVFP